MKKRRMSTKKKRGGGGGGRVKAFKVADNFGDNDEGCGGGGVSCCGGGGVAGIVVVEVFTGIDCGVKVLVLMVMIQLHEW